MSNALRNLAQDPVAWFVLLDQAVKAGEFDRAAVAERKLRALGVEVRYRTPPREESSMKGGVA